MNNVIQVRLFGIMGGEESHMLQARTRDGTLITLATLTKEELEKYKAKTFFCPTCHESVIVKAGPQVIPHFAHRSKMKCPSYQNGEGPYHEQGKLLLYQWLKSQHLDVQLEPYVRKIKQQPDLLITINNKKLAIEFQCARIPMSHIQHRNDGYKQANIHPIWILGAKRFKRHSKDKLIIDQFSRQFIHRFSPSYPLILFYFCPETLQFLTFQHIYFTQSNQAIGQFKFNHLKTFKFTDLFNVFPPSRSHVYELWKIEKKNFRTRPQPRLYGQHLAWHKWLYSKHTHIQYLPSIVHLPVSMQYQMKSPPWNWQSRLCIDILHPLPVGSHVCIKRCTHFLRHHVHHPNTFPLIHSSKHPIRQYFRLLEKLNIMKQWSAYDYEKINTIHFHTHVDEALFHDQRIMDQLITQGK